MTRADTAKLIAIIVMTYPNFDEYKDNDHSSNATPSQSGKNGRTQARSGASGQTTRQGQQNAPQGSQSAAKQLSQAQLDRMYRKGTDAGVTKESVDAYILKHFNIKEPEKMTRQQYDRACSELDDQKVVAILQINA